MDNYNLLGLPQWVGSRLVWRTGMIERLATNGAVRLRALYSAPKRDPIVVHGFLSSAQKTALEDFYAAHRTMTFYFTATEDGVQRICVFSSQPMEIVPMQDVPELFQATVYMREA